MKPTRAPGVPPAPGDPAYYRRGAGWPVDRLEPLVLTADEERHLATGLAALMPRQRGSEQ